MEPTAARGPTKTPPVGPPEAATATKMVVNRDVEETPVAPARTTNYNVRELLELERKIYDESIEKQGRLNEALQQGTLHEYLVQCLPLESERDRALEVAKTRFQLSRRNASDLLAFELKQAGDIYEVGGPASRWLHCVLSRLITPSLLSIRPIVWISSSDFAPLWSASELASSSDSTRSRTGSHSPCTTMPTLSRWPARTTAASRPLMRPSSRRTDRSIQWRWSNSSQRRTQPTSRRSTSTTWSTIYRPRMPLSLTSWTKSNAIKLS
jgi:hypothetical protein